MYAYSILGGISLRAIDIYEIASTASFDFIADDIMCAASELEARDAAVVCAVVELQRLGVVHEMIVGVDRLEGWAAAQWRRHHALAA